jgi:hypothetical protein
MNLVRPEQRRRALISFEDEVAAHGLVGLGVLEACSAASGGRESQESLTSLEQSLATLWAQLEQHPDITLVLEHGIVQPSAWRSAHGSETTSAGGGAPHEGEAAVQLGVDGSCKGALPRGSRRRTLDEKSISAVMLTRDFGALTSEVQRLLAEDATLPATAVPPATSRLRRDLTEWGKAPHHARKPIPHLPPQPPAGDGSEVEGAGAAASASSAEESSTTAHANLDRLRLVATQRARDTVLVGTAGVVAPVERAILDVVAQAKRDGMLEVDIEAVFGRRPGRLRPELDSLVSKRFVCVCARTHMQGKHARKQAHTHTHTGASRHTYTHHTS